MYLKVYVVIFNISGNFLSPNIPNISYMHSEEVGHNFRGICILLLRIMCNVLFLLTQRVDLGCVGVLCSCAHMHICMITYSN